MFKISQSILFLIIIFLMTKNKLENMADGNVMNDIKKLLKIDFDNIINLNNIINNMDDGKLNINELNIEGKLNFLPRGSIVMWTLNEIPKGWLICNGSNGTPDLRNRFIVGVGDKYKLNDIGGSDTIILTVNQIPAHNHNVTIDSMVAGNHHHRISVREHQDNVRGRSGESILNYHGGDVTSTTDGNHAHPCSITINNTGSSQPHENRPPYFSLIYIMREI
jgi:microcystin-dependent protein